MMERKEAERNEETSADKEYRKHDTLERRERINKREEMMTLMRESEMEKMIPWYDDRLREEWENCPLMDELLRELLSSSQ